MKIHSRKSLMGVGAVAMLFLMGCTATPSPNDKKSDVLPVGVRSISFPETEFDFGLIKQSGGEVRHDFKFTYNGDIPIEITGTPASCECTSATVDRTMLNPGDSGVLTVKFNPNLHAEPDGRFFKTVMLLTKPPLSPEPEVKIWVEIDLDLGPEAFELKEDHDETAEDVEDPQEISGGARAGYVEAEAYVVNKKNAGNIKIEFGNAAPAGMPASDKTLLLLSLNNHRDNLAEYDYKNLSSLDGIKAEKWTLLSDKMGGHHVSGILEFPRQTSPKILSISGLPAGNMTIRLSRQSP